MHLFYIFFYSLVWLIISCVPIDIESFHFLFQEEARNTINSLLGKLDFGSSEVCVRINSVDTGEAEEDLKAILTASKPPHSIVIPKVETVEHIDWVSLLKVTCEH